MIVSAQPAKRYCRLSGICCHEEQEQSEFCLYPRSLFREKDEDGPLTSEMNCLCDYMIRASILNLWSLKVNHTPGGACNVALGLYIFRKTSQRAVSERGRLVPGATACTNDLVAIYLEPQALEAAYEVSVDCQIEKQLQSFEIDDDRLIKWRLVIPAKKLSSLERNLTHTLCLDFHFRPIELQGEPHARRSA